MTCAQQARVVATICALGLLLSLMGCATYPPVKPPLNGKFSNACLPEAILMTQALREKNIRAKVIAYTWGNPVKPAGHAFTAYMYPTRRNQLWGWDSFSQSIRLRAWWSDDTAIAREFALKSHRGGPVLQAVTIER
jgi:hypothetical protein